MVQPSLDEQSLTLQQAEEFDAFGILTKDNKTLVYFFFIYNRHIPIDDTIFLQFFYSFINCGNRKIELQGKLFIGLFAVFLKQFN